MCLENLTVHVTWPRILKLHQAIAWYLSIISWDFSGNESLCASLIKFDVNLTEIFV